MTVDIDRLLATNVPIPLHTVMGTLPPDWWKSKAQQAANQLATQAVALKENK